MRSECWGSAPLFPDELDSESVPGLQVTSEDTLYISKQILSFLEVTGSNPEIEMALRIAVRRGSRALRLLPLRKLWLLRQAQASSGGMQAESAARRVEWSGAQLTSTAT